jgi:hypothetical protein
MRPWFPDLVTKFFLSQQWNRPTDAQTALQLAEDLAEINATESEVTEAFRWARQNPTENGKKVIGRPDQLNRVLGRIKSRRRHLPQAAPASMRSPNSQAPSPGETAWVAATEEQREHARRRACARGLKGPSLLFDIACQTELLKVIRLSTMVEVLPASEDPGMSTE